MAITQAQFNALQPKPQSNPAANKAMDKDAFLKLFVAQLKHQDPLNPMTDKEALGQLAQFSQLEQLTNLNTAIAKLATDIKVANTTQASSLIGKNVLADGNVVALKSGKATGVNLNIPHDAKTVKVNIHDKAGNIVRTIDLGSRKAGEVSFKWDGKNTDGNTGDDGTYRISVVAEDADGKRMFVKAQVEGKVKGVLVESGKQVLELQDGRKVLLANVWKIAADA